MAKYTSDTNLIKGAADAYKNWDNVPGMYKGLEDLSKASRDMATKKVAERAETGNLGSKLLEGKEKLDAVAESPMAQNAQKVKQKLDENRQRNAQQNMQMQNDMREAAKTNARTGNTTTGFN